MSQEAIAERVERARKKQLRELFGTDNEKEVKAIAARAKNAGKLMTDEQQQEYNRLKRLEEARKRSRMTQEQRVSQELETRENRIKELETQIAERDRSDAIRQQDQVIGDAAAAHIEPSCMKYARRDLAEYLQELRAGNPEQFAKFGPKQLERWFQKYSQDQPAFAKKTAQEPAAKPSGQPTAPPVKRPVTTTSRQARPPEAGVKDGPGMFNGKTIKPGQPNSMNKAELREYMKSQGRRIPY